MTVEEVIVFGIALNVTAGLAPSPSPGSTTGSARGATIAIGLAALFASASRCWSSILEGGVLGLGAALGAVPRPGPGGEPLACARMAPPATGRRSSGCSRCRGGSRPSSGLPRSAPRPRRPAASAGGWRRSCRFSPSASPSSSPKSRPHPLQSVNYLGASSLRRARVKVVLTEPVVILGRGTLWSYSRAIRAARTGPTADAGSRGGGRPPRRRSAQHAEPRNRAPTPKPATPACSTRCATRAARPRSRRWFR